MDRRQLALLGLLPAGLMIALWFSWRHLPQSWLLPALDAQLHTLPAEDLPGHLRQRLPLGDAGLVSLVNGLQHPRAEVAQAAVAILHQQLDDWQQLPATDSSPYVARLAQLLAAAKPPAAPEVDQSVRKLARRILLWPLDRSQIDGAAVVDHCAVVLRRPPPADADRHRHQITRQLEAAADQLRLPHSDRATYSPQNPPLAESARDKPSRDDVSAENARPPVILPPLQTLHPSEITVAENESVESARPLAAADSEPSAKTRPLPGEPTTQGDVPGDDRGPLLTSSSPGLFPVDGRTDSADNEDLRALGERSLIAMLASEDPLQSAAARRELERRGYGALDLEIAARAGDPDPQVRCRLAEALPGLTSTDVRRWLLLLAADEHAEVRRTAAAILATSSDPKLRARIR